MLTRPFQNPDFFFSLCVFCLIVLLHAPSFSRSKVIFLNFFYEAYALLCSVVVFSSKHNIILPKNSTQRFPDMLQSTEVFSSYRHTGESFGIFFWEAVLYLMLFFVNVISYYISVYCGEGIASFGKFKRFLQVILCHLLTWCDPTESWGSCAIHTSDLISLTGTLDSRLLLGNCQLKLTVFDKDIKTFCALLV